MLPVLNADSGKSFTLFGKEAKKKQKGKMVGSQGLKCREREER